MDSDTTVKLGYERSAIVEFKNENVPARSKSELMRLVFGGNVTLLTISWVQTLTNEDSSVHAKKQQHQS